MRPNRQRGSGVAGHSAGVDGYGAERVGAIHKCDVASWNSTVAGHGRGERDRAGDLHGLVAGDDADGGGGLDDGERECRRGAACVVGVAHIVGRDGIVTGRQCRGGEGRRPCSVQRARTQQRRSVVEIHGARGGPAVGGYGRGQRERLAGDGRVRARCHSRGRRGDVDGLRNRRGGAGEVIRVASIGGSNRMRSRSQSRGLEGRYGARGTSWSQRARPDLQSAVVERYRPGRHNGTHRRDDGRECDRRPVDGGVGAGGDRRRGCLLHNLIERRGGRADVVGIGEGCGDRVAAHRQVRRRVGCRAAVQGSAAQVSRAVVEGDRAGNRNSA